MQVHCEFRVLDCPHGRAQPMFSTEYKRSNRTRMSKILRCFPHCCPTHRPRSYCGSALHVHVTLVGEQAGSGEPRAATPADDEQLPLWKLDVLSPAQALTDFIVFGRFEVHDPDDPLKTDLALGQRLLSTDITTNRDPDVIWVAGHHATHQSALALVESNTTSPSRVFVLNEGDGESHHWEYDWRSGTSQRKRACQHQFRAYVFLADTTDPSLWQVVGVASSTPFTLSSYRKQDDDDYDPSGAGEMSLIQELSAAVAAGGVLPPVAQPSASPVAAPPVNELLMLRQNQLVVGATTKLAVVLNLLAVIDVSWVTGDVLTDHVISILRSNPDTPPPSLVYYATLDQSLHQYATRCVMPLLTALRAVSPRARSDAWLTKWSGLLKLCVDLFCQLIKDGRLAELQALVRHAARRQSLNDASVMTTFVEFAKTLERLAEESIPQLSHHASLDLLVDDIVTCVFEEDPDFDWVPRPTRDAALRLLRNTTLLGLHPYRDQLRLCSALPDAPFNTVPSEVSRLFTGVWTCVSVDPSASLSLPPPPVDFGFSALAAIQFLTAAHKIELAMDGDATELRVRSAWSCFAELWSAHVLDGELHASSVLPNGLCAGLWQQLGAGAVVGDYRGALRQADDGAIVLDLDVFAYSVAAPSYCLQLTMVPAATDLALQLVAHVRVYRSRLVVEAHAMATQELAPLTPAQRSGLVSFVAEDLVVAATLVYGQTQA